MIKIDELILAFYKRCRYKINIIYNYRIIKEKLGKIKNKIIYWKGRIVI